MAATTGLEKYFNKKRQAFKGNGRSYYKLSLYIEVEDGKEQPPTHWKWDSIMFPNRATLTDQISVTHADAVAAGLVKRDEGPTCTACNDHGYELWRITTERDLEELKCFFKYWDKAMIAESCSECAGIDRGDMIDTVYADFRTDRDYPLFRMHSRPIAGKDSVAYGEGNWPENRELMVLRGTKDYYPEPYTRASDVQMLVKNWQKRYPEEEKTEEAVVEDPVPAPADAVEEVQAVAMDNEAAERVLNEFINDEIRAAANPYAADRPLRRGARI